MERGRYRWMSPAARVPQQVASFPARLMFTELDHTTFRLDGMAGAPEPGSHQPPLVWPRDPTSQMFSMMVAAPTDSWVGVAVLTLDRWTTTDPPLHVEIIRRGGLHQARISDGAATVLFDVRSIDGPPWLRIERSTSS